MEDYRIGRKTVSTATDKVVGATSSGVIPAALARVALIIGPPTAGTLSLTVLPTAVAGRGIVLAAGAAPIILDIQHHGDIVRRGFQGIHSAGGVAFEYFETFLNDEIPK